jgi:predicted nucleic acid-binding protein
MHRLQIYVDTSVFGGVYDEQFAESSRSFLEQVEQGRYRILVSTITYDELQGAPDRVRRLIEGLPLDVVVEIAIDAEVKALAAAYIAAGALQPTMENDALHVAAATVARADAILSWNFKHIVNFDRIRKFNGVNVMNGYGQIPIHSPLELTYDNQEEDI